jgi:uncharacterized protein (DUF1800 family)
MRIMTLSTGALVVTVALGLTQPAPRAATLPDDDRTIAHVLNRIGFGPRPGDIERVRTIGLQRYIDQQLHPERVEDAGMTARLAGLTTVSMSSREIAREYARPAVDASRARRRQQQSMRDADRTAGDPALATQAPPEPAERRANAVVVELAQQKLLRAMYSERQLQEVLADFWFNHFNVDVRKGPVRFLVTEYERETIRPHVLGRFRDLLGATAKSPAMLFYLDNWLSVDPAARERVVATRHAARGGARSPSRTGPQAGGRRTGLNENYARELMELHTLGVDGGYTQKDVTEVARAFTGWTIAAPRQGTGFRFEPSLHDPGEKVVLGRQIRAGGGIEDGEQVLDILAAHPSTARFISSKLARRFVSDHPPAALVDRLAARFLDTRGDLRAVTAALLSSPEFVAADSVGAKVKNPFEFVVSAVRASGLAPADVRPLVRSLQELGMPMYQCQPPTGYKDTADAWMSTGALVARMNVALALSGRAGGALPGTAAGVGAVLGIGLSATTRETISKAATPQQALALTLGSPEFQKR